MCPVGEGSFRGPSLQGLRDCYSVSEFRRLRMPPSVRGGDISMRDRGRDTWSDTDRDERRDGTRTMRDGVAAEWTDCGATSLPLPLAALGPAGENTGLGTDAGVRTGAGVQAAGAGDLPLPTSAELLSAEFPRTGVAGRAVGSHRLPRRVDGWDPHTLTSSSSSSSATLGYRSSAAMFRLVCDMVLAARTASSCLATNTCIFTRRSFDRSMAR